MTTSEGEGRPDGGTGTTRPNPLDEGSPVWRWLEAERARVAAIPAYHADLLAKEAGFFRKVVAAALTVMPEAVEMRLFGSRASMEHGRNSDWDFLVVAPTLTNDRRLDLAVRGRGGTSDVTRVARRRVDLVAASTDEIAKEGSAYMDGLLEHNLVVWRLDGDLTSTTDDDAARDARREPPE